MMVMVMVMVNEESKRNLVVVVNEESKRNVLVVVEENNKCEEEEIQM